VSVAYGSGQRALFVDVTIDGDASSSCTTSDDVTTTSDDVISNPGSDVTESPQHQLPTNHQQAQPVGDNSVWSEDSGHCSGASDVTVTSSSDTDTLDAGSEKEDDDDDDDGGNDDDADDESHITSGTLDGCSSSSTVTSSDNLSILDLLENSCRVTDL